MDPNETRVDTDFKEAKQVVNTTNEKQEEKEQNVNEDLKGKREEENTTLSPQTVTEKEDIVESVITTEKPQTSSSTQSDQESLLTPEEKEEDKHNDNETGKENENQSSQPKHWKNPRKKKLKDETIGDVSQWPTLDEARFSRGQPPKKTQGESGSRNPSKSERDRDRQNSSRARRGINWKPLSELSKSQASGEQSSFSSGNSPSTSVSGEGEREGTNQSSVPSSGGSGRGYQGGYLRGQNKRRGRSQPAHWSRSSPQHFSQDGTSTSNEPGAPLPQETEGKDDSNHSQNTQDSATSAQLQTGFSGQTSNPPQDSRRSRGSVRGTARASHRWRGGNFPRATYYNRYNPPRGGQTFPPLRVPQDPEQLREQTKKQIEYYFGIDNLCKDVFLRKNMNTEGWISIHLILNFNRVREMGIDLQRFVDALKDSTVVEVKDEFIRRRNDWARWTFPPRVEGLGASQTPPSQPQEVISPTETQGQ